jgi:hypothetical protein
VQDCLCVGHVPSRERLPRLWAVGGGGVEGQPRRSVVVCWRQVSLPGHFQGRETEMPKHRPRHLEREETVELPGGQNGDPAAPLLCSVCFILGSSTYHELNEELTPNTPNQTYHT